MPGGKRRSSVLCKLLQIQGKASAQLQWPLLPGKPGSSSENRPGPLLAGVPLIRDSGLEKRRTDRATALTHNLEAPAAPAPAPALDHSSLFSDLFPRTLLVRSRPSGRGGRLMLARGLDILQRDATMYYVNASSMYHVEVITMYFAH